MVKDIDSIDLDDPYTSKIAEVMSNRTCKKILNALSEKEMSEGDLAKILGIPINTVEYNLNKLLDVKLIQKSEKYFWSERGKKIPVYKLADKKIVISSKISQKNYVPVLAVSFLFLIIAAVASVFIIQYFTPFEMNFPGFDISETGEEVGLEHFESYEDIKNFLEENKENMGGYGGYGRGLLLETAMAGSVSEKGPVASDFSKTNIQVVGVDEPDIIKNDGKYIYSVVDNKIIIVDAFPAENMNIISKIEMKEDNYVNGIFVNEDKLIVLMNVYQSYEENSNDVAPASKRLWVGGYYPPDRSKTSVIVYDLSDIENPKIANSYSVDGGYATARMIDDYAYIISTIGVNYENPILPLVEVNGQVFETKASDIAYYPGSYQGFVFTSVFAVNLEDDQFNNEVFLTDASGGNIYVSEDNIYLTSIKRVSYSEYLEGYVKTLDDVLPSLVFEEVEDVFNSDLESYEKNTKIQEIISDYSLTLKGSLKSDFDQELFNALEEYEEEFNKLEEKTVIHKINVDRLDITYEASGEVLGHTLNQFSMDEFKDTFRIATTTGNVFEGKSFNHVFVLDKDLEVIGRLEDLAKGEQIYSARFMGERAYLVTFKKVDPFFVIDLSNPEKPEVLGFLKIPGFSDYLHPYDEDHVIGVGKETVEASEDDKGQRNLNFAWYQGVKISLFDVSDVTNPIEKAKIIIGDRGSDSYALNDHKAFLFDKERNLLVIPISEAKIDESQYKGEIPPTAWGEIVWDGAYVLNIDTEDISIRGKVSHKQEGEQKRYYDYYNTIQRSLYMDDVLYTWSPRMIKANDIVSLEEIANVIIALPDPVVIEEY